jgi:hypothetical protein
MFCNELNHACVYACSYNLCELCILPCPSSSYYIQFLKVYICSVYIYAVADVEGGVRGVRPPKIRKANVMQR